MHIFSQNSRSKTNTARYYTYMYNTCTQSSSKVPTIVLKSKLNLNIVNKFSKNNEISNMKSVKWQSMRESEIHTKSE